VGTFKDFSVGTKTAISHEFLYLLSRNDEECKELVEISPVGLLGYGENTSAMQVSSSTKKNIDDGNEKGLNSFGVFNIEVPSGNRALLFLFVGHVALDLDPNLVGPRPSIKPGFNINEQNKFFKDIKMYSERPAGEIVRSEVLKSDTLQVSGGSFSVSYGVFDWSHTHGASFRASDFEKIQFSVYDLGEGDALV
jgi:hypothetical protein